MKPSTRAVPPACSTSASSMQSPPARAEATRVIILSPVFARPGAPPRSRCFRRSWGRPRRRARVAGRISPALATRRWSSKAIWMRSGWLPGSIYRVLLFWDRFSVSKPLSQIQRRTLLFLQQASCTPSFGGLGFTRSGATLAKSPSSTCRATQAHHQAVVRRLPGLQRQHLSCSAHVPGAGRHGLRTHHRCDHSLSGGTSGPSRPCSTRITRPAPQFT